MVQVLIRLLWMNWHTVNNIIQDLSQQLEQNMLYICNIFQVHTPGTVAKWFEYCSTKMLCSFLRVQICLNALKRIVFPPLFLVIGYCIVSDHLFL